MFALATRERSDSLKSARASYQDCLPKVSFHFGFVKV